MERWKSADGRYYDDPKFDGRLRNALVSDVVLAEHYDPQCAPRRDDDDMAHHLARQLGWTYRGASIATMDYLARELNELFNGFPLDSDALATTLADAALKGTGASELVDLVLHGPKALRSAGLPPEVTRYDNLAKHTRPVVQKALRSQLRALFEAWNRLDFTEVADRLRPSWRPREPSEPGKPDRSDRRKDREGMSFRPSYR